MLKTRQLVVAKVMVLLIMGMASGNTIDSDWLVTQIKEPVRIEERLDGKEIVLGNALISRTFRLLPNAATVAYVNLMTGQSVIRGIKPEAIVELDGRSYEVGGLQGQLEYGYLLASQVDSFTANPDAFVFRRYEIGATKERFSWKRKRYSGRSIWPPPGKSLTLHFEPPAGRLNGLRLSIHYEMYQGIPLLSKWLTISNGTGKPVRLNTFTSEILAAVEYESLVGEPRRWEYPNIHIESDYAFHGGDPKNANKTAHWLADPQYGTQVNYRRQTPVMLEVRPPLGPDLIIEPGSKSESFRTYELIFDSTERERKGLSLRRMYRTIAPWSTENPIIMHVRRADPESVRLAIDQCAEVGFEMVIMTFGSGLNMENISNFYKEYRDILDSDIIHVRRPDGSDIDCILHVNPQLKCKGLAMVYNPLDREVKRQLRLPLYYTGLARTARIREQRGKYKKFRLDRKYNVEIPVAVAPGGVTWFVIE